MSSTTETPDRSLREINTPTPFLLAPWLMWVNLRKYHYLVSNFIKRDLRLKYRNSVLGYFWSLLEPLLLAGVYYVLFSIIANRPEENYPLWVLVGVLTWGYFSRCLNGSVACLTKNVSMIKGVFFPRELYALTNVGSNLIITMLSMLVVIPFMIYLGLIPNLNLLMVPLGLLLMSMLALGLGLGVASLNAVNRDVEHFFRFLTRVGFFLSPVMWTIEMAPSSRVDHLLLNPMVVPITMVRNRIDGRTLGIEGLFVFYSVLFCLLSFILGTMFFKRHEAGVVKRL